MGTSLEELKTGDRVRVQGGRNFEKFHGGMEGTILENSVDSRNMRVQFDDAATAGPEPLTVAYRHLEFAPERGGYRAGQAPQVAGAEGGAKPNSQAPKEPQGPLLEEHGDFRTRQLVQLGGLQSAAAQELNGRLARLRRYDPAGERWEVDVRNGLGIKRLKEENLTAPPKPQVPSGLQVAELKERGNKAFLEQAYEEAIAYYAAALELLEDDETTPPEAEDPKYTAVLYSNRAQVYITLCREVHGEEKQVSKEARMYAMRANMDSAKAIDLDPTFGKAYYRRGCAVLGMAPSASRAKEAIHCLEIALSGRASGGKDGIVLPNAMRHEVSNLMDYAKRRLDACVEAAVPDVEQCRENCRQQ
eukprot:CAMPEP_0198504760 /NCGR_PEP_ID=MMETSP1462-20131121/10659_1 /TAXON_ID=1333877 /ORGANISM="Brandtodinium nutriculum, Strain RCC3387" /LENGTH=359 /DNA_ID=CAMNT_0044233933 /DNA_START=76 /DNA_END=1155 /DNA_ORIENTATION=-